MKKELYTLPEYIKHLGQLYTPEELHADSLISNYKFSNFFFPTSSAVFFILDYRTGKFEYLSRNFNSEFRHYHESLTEGGMEFFNFIQHPDDKRIFINDIFKHRLSFMSKVPGPDHANYCYSNNFRLIDSNKKYHHFLRQHVNAKTDEQGMPLIAAGVCIDISSFKNDTRMVDAIFKLDAQNGLTEIYSHNYFPCEDGVLSRRETEILKYILEGLTSEKIADKLFLSHHTVKTHRKNMLQKTNSKNTGDLLRYAIENGIV